MAASVLIITLTLTVILFQKIDITYKKDKTDTLSLDFIFFGLSFDLRKKEKGASFKLKFIKKIPSVIKALDYFLKKSEFRVYENLFMQGYETERAFEFENIPIFISLYSVLPVIKEKARVFEFKSSNAREREKLKIYLSVKLIDMIISVIIFQYYSLRNEAKRGT